jgi:hypothetical protein
MFVFVWVVSSELTNQDKNNEEAISWQNCIRTFLIVGFRILPKNWIPTKDGTVEEIVLSFHIQILKNFCLGRFENND